MLAVLVIRYFDPGLEPDSKQHHLVLAIRYNALSALTVSSLLRWL